MFKIFSKNSQNLYFSHYGEDVVLHYIFKNQSKGIYLDIGCYHPSLFSNTKKLYDRGWKGVNIDANSDTIALFNKARPRDINVNIGVSGSQGQLEYFKFLDIDEAGGGSGNSFSIDVRKKYEKQGLVANVSKVDTDTLVNIYNKYLPNEYVDFLNIDVEGLDLTVLESNDWDVFRPRVIAIEIWSKDIDFDNPLMNKTYSFLRKKGYIPFSCTIFSWFFYDSDNPIDLS